MHAHVHQKQTLVREFAGDLVERKRHQRVEVKNSSDLVSARRRARVSSGESGS
jgi:hypothetical protein